MLAKKALKVAGKQGEKMQINFEEMSGVSVFKVTGDIDINSSPDMKKGV